MKYRLSSLLVPILMVIILAVPAFSAEKVEKITGAVELGYTKQDVVKKMGAPNSPQKFDFFYEKGKTEVMVTFDDKSSKVNSVIIRGADPKYSVSGIKSGDLKSAVKQTFGAPERVVNYKKSNVECWYYPSKNVNFAFSGDKVASFSISNVNVGK